MCQGGVGLFLPSPLERTLVICANSAFTGCFSKLDSYESDDSDASGESCDFGESVFFFL